MTGEFRTGTRVLLGSALAFAGVSHLTIGRDAFQAQVPDWVPLETDFVVVASGVVEIALGSALLLAPKRARATIGTLGAIFFTAIFPGNIAQFTEKRNAFGLDSDLKRGLRLLGQPLLVAAALFSTR